LLLNRIDLEISFEKDRFNGLFHLWRIENPDNYRMI